MKIKVIYLLQLFTFTLTYGYMKCKLRPFYNMAHMVNSIEEVIPALEKNANAFEFDIRFYGNGSVKAVYHGPPCDCDRNCSKTAPLPDYLDYIHTKTDPSVNKTYYNQLSIVMFDLKLQFITSEKGYFQAGQEIADNIIDHLWKINGPPQRLLVKAVLFVPSTKYINFLQSFLHRFRQRNLEYLLKNVGFDGGMESNEVIFKMFQKLNVSSNIWQGSGTINCYSANYTDLRIDGILQIRNNLNGYIDKAYQWTIDNSTALENSLKRNVDAIITNLPLRLHDLIVNKYSNIFRFATVHDNPFEKIPYPIE